MKRLKLVAAILPPAWLLITALLMLWKPIIQDLPEWQVAALIAPQVILAMTFLITPTVQRLLTRR